MKIMKLGNQGLEVSRLGLGCMGLTAIYGETNAVSSKKVLERDIELGINFFDTSLVNEGKVKYRGVSEVSTKELERTNKIHSITAVQNEYSLWTRGIEKDLFGKARELGTGIVAYSPLGRGFLTGDIKAAKALSENDWRKSNPRFVRRQ